MKVSLSAVICVKMRVKRIKRKLYKDYDFVYLCINFRCAKLAQKRGNNE